MTIEDRARRVNSVIQASLDTGMLALEGVHQMAAEIPLDVAVVLGLPVDKAALIKDTHRRILRSVYGGIRKSQSELGALFVDQAGELRTLAVELSAGSGEAQRMPATPRKKAAKKKRVTAKKAAPARSAPVEDSEPDGSE